MPNDAKRKLCVAVMKNGKVCGLKADEGWHDPKLHDYPVCKNKPEECLYHEYQPAEAER